MIDGHLAYKLTPELLLVHCRPSSANFQRFSTPPLTKNKKRYNKKSYEKG
ncbi:GM19445 [Drosophila sechellia]|uniref:GM19445 n=1 Tax=Drosophila sechellia TaxID=7238 RepID=B4I1G0_DROSE|nr:GM19445 [Drosophila sechellia]